MQAPRNPDEFLVDQAIFASQDLIAAAERSLRKNGKRHRPRYDLFERSDNAHRQGA